VHLIGDYVAQSDWMATENAKRFAPAVPRPRVTRWASCVPVINRPWLVDLRVALLRRPLWEAAVIEDPLYRNQSLSLRLFASGKLDRTQCVNIAAKPSSQPRGGHVPAALPDGEREKHCRGEAGDCDRLHSLFLPGSIPP
jgi:hypothetical protein